MIFSNNIPSLSSFMKESQTLEDYSSGEAENIVNKQLSYNPKFQELSQEEKDEQFFDVYFK